MTTESKKDKVDKADDDIREALKELTKEITKLVVETTSMRKEFEKWRTAGKF